MAHALADFVSPEDLEALYRPTGEAHGLPASVYSEAFFKLDNEVLFPSTWAAVAVTADLPDPGDAYPVMLGDWPLLLVRNGAGRINGFLNICRHRRMRVVIEPCKQRRKLSCPWHCWTYDLDGRLVATPNLGGIGIGEVPEINRDELGLKPVRVALWHDFIFVNIDGKAPAFDIHRQPIDALLADYDLGSLKYGGRSEIFYEGNWKLAIEGTLEDYHLSYLHPQFPVDSGPPEFHEAVHRGRCYVGHRERRLTLGDDGLPTTLREGAEGKYGFIVDLFPTGVLRAALGHVNYLLFVPDGPYRTRVASHFYFNEAVVNDPVYAGHIQEVKDSWEELLPQDADCMRYVSENFKVADQALIQPHFSPYWDIPVHIFQKMVIETLQDAECAVREV